MSTPYGGFVGVKRITGKTDTFSGTTGIKITVATSYFPILDKNNFGPATFGNSSISGWSTYATNEVTSAELVQNPGDYYVDYVNGVITIIPKATGSITITYSILGLVTTT